MPGNKLGGGFLDYLPTSGEDSGQKGLKILLQSPVYDVFFQVEHQFIL